MTIRSCLRIGRTLWIAKLSLALSMLFLPGCGSSTEDPVLQEALMKAQTFQTTTDVVVYVCNVSRWEHSAPPLTMEELIAWIAKKSPKFLEEPYVSADGRSVVDAWGSSMLLIAEEGRLRRIGSCGRNKMWDGGQGDDVVSLEIRWEWSGYEPEKAGGGVEQPLSSAVWHGGSCPAVCLLWAGCHACARHKHAGAAGP